MTVALRNGIRALQQAGALATPAAGTRLLYPKSDGWYEKDSAGVEAKLGGAAVSGTKVSALTAVTTPVGTDEFPVNQGGTSKKMTLTQINAYAEPVSNASVATQSPAAATDVYITDSSIALPQTRLQARTFVRWRFMASKTAAGTATPIFVIRHGTARTTADAARCTITCGAQSAVANAGCMMEVFATFRSVGAGTAAVLQGGVGQGVAGFHTVGGVATSAGFDSTVANTFIGFSLNAGTSGAWTITQVQGDILNIT